MLLPCDCCIAGAAPALAKSGGQKRHGRRANAIRLVISIHCAGDIARCRACPTSHFSSGIPPFRTLPPLLLLLPHLTPLSDLRTKPPPGICAIHSIDTTSFHMHLTHLPSHICTSTSAQHPVDPGALLKLEISKRWSTSPPQSQTQGQRARLRPKGSGGGGGLSVT